MVTGSTIEACLRPIFILSMSIGECVARVNAANTYCIENGSLSGRQGFNRKVFGSGASNFYLSSNPAVQIRNADTKTIRKRQMHRNHHC